MGNKNRVLSYEDYYMRKERKDNSLISIRTALKRTECAESEGFLKDSLGGKYWWSIKELSGEYMGENDELYNKEVSFQDLLKTHFETMLKLNFDNLQRIHNIPTLNYQKAMYETIISYATEFSQYDQEGNLYTMQDATGVDVLGEYLEKYYNTYKDALDRKRTIMPDEVCEYIEKIGYMADREDYQKMGSDTEKEI